MNNNYKEVRFDEYCASCKHVNVNDSPYDGRVVRCKEDDYNVKTAENVCDDCLSCPMRSGSNKPLRYEPK